MTTLLSNPVSREVVLDDTAYKVTISPTGVTIAKKGHRRRAEVGWDNILALSDLKSAPPASRAQSANTDLPEPIAADTARQIKAARDALQRAAEVLARAGSLPASVLSTLEPDPVYGRVEHRTDWFIEPLLTPNEVASILRISTRSAAALPIAHLFVGGERRYRQSEVRRYVLDQEMKDSPSLRWR